jgi:thioester reductase-like protein
VIFIFEYSLAHLIKGWGIEPYAMIGYSFGEYVAACLADVFSLEDALKLVVARSQLICQTPRGVMLSVPIPVNKVKQFMMDNLSISVDNGQSCIISGPPRAVQEFANVMKENRYMCTYLESTHAVHSELMDPILKEFERQVSQVKLNRPQIPYISNVTGNWITVQEATDPSYWASHLRETVRFADGIKLIMNSNAIFVEVGPGNALSAMIRGYFDDNSKQKVVPLVPPAGKDISDIRFLLEQIGNLWLYGKNINWDSFHKGKKRHRIPLPTYPFEQQRYWIDWDSVDIEGSTFLKNFHLSNKKSSSQFFTKKINEGSQIQEASPGALDLHEHLQLSSEYVPPETELDSQLTEIYRNFLGISQVGIMDDFFELGMDSLKTINIGVEIYKKLNVKIDLAILLEFSNIKELSEYISQTQNKNPEEQANTSVDVDGNINNSNNSNTTYPVDGVLKESTNEESNEEFSVTNITGSIEIPQDIFITGSTGFLGAHLLKELINKTESRIYCLLRGDGSLEVFQRMRKIWQYYFDVELEEFYKKRLFIVRGDLTKSYMGIKREFYDELVENVDTVIHSAADVRHYGKYAELRETNVNGTQRVIDFCLSGMRKKMHHISTVGVTGVPSSRVCFKESDLYIGQNFEGLVYSKSKFEAEILVQQARKKGLKASIYRIGNLVGRHEDGVFQKNIETNQIYNDIKALISLGQFPSNIGNYEIEITPVDLCTQALIKLIILKDTIGYNFHLMNPYLLPLKKLIHFINKFGFEIEPVDFQDFYNHVYSEVTSKNFTRSITGIFYNLREENEIDDSEERMVTFESTFTQQVLKKTGFSWLELDFDYMSRMLKHAIEVRYLSF